VWKLMFMGRTISTNPSMCPVSSIRSDTRRNSRNSRQNMRVIMYKMIKDIITKHMPVKYMLTGRNNQDLHVFIGMVLFLIVAYFVGV